MTRKYNKPDNRRAFYESRLESQEGKCAICKQPGRLVIDHNHDTGLMRGLLCFKHNTALGLFNDSPEILQAAITYLETCDPEKYAIIAASNLIKEKKQAIENLMQTLLNDITFSSDRARARVFAEKVGCKESTAQTRLQRARKKKKL